MGTSPVLDKSSRTNKQLRLLLFSPDFEKKWQIVNSQKPIVSSFYRQQRSLTAGREVRKELLTQIKDLASRNLIRNDSKTRCLLISGSHGDARGASVVSCKD